MRGACTCGGGVEADGHRGLLRQDRVRVRVAATHARPPLADNAPPPSPPTARATWLATVLDPSPSSGLRHAVDVLSGETLHRICVLSSRLRWPTRQAVGWLTDGRRWCRTSPNSSSTCSSVRRLPKTWTDACLRQRCLHQAAPQVAHAQPHRGRHDTAILSHSGWAPGATAQSVLTTCASTGVVGRRLMTCTRSVGVSSSTCAAGQSHPVDRLRWATFTGLRNQHAAFGSLHRTLAASTKSVMALRVSGSAPPRDRYLNACARAGRRARFVPAVDATACRAKSARTPAEHVARWYLLFAGVGGAAELLPVGVPIDEDGQHLVVRNEGVCDLEPATDTLRLLAGRKPSPSKVHSGEGAG